MTSSSERMSPSSNCSRSDLLLGVAGLGVAAQLDAAAGVDLRDAEGQDLAAQRRRLAGRADQPVYGTAQPQDRHQPLEVVVADQPALVELHAPGRPQPREADRVRAAVVVLLQVQGVAHQAEHLEPPVVQAEQGADAHVVAARPPSPGPAVEPPEVIALARAGRMDAA